MIRPEKRAQTSGANTLKSSSNGKEDGRPAQPAAWVCIVRKQVLPLFSKPKVESNPKWHGWTHWVRQLFYIHSGEHLAKALGIKIVLIVIQICLWKTIWVEMLNWANHLWCYKCTRGSGCLKCSDFKAFKLYLLWLPRAQRMWLVQC